MERDRIGREEMVFLPCRATHQIKPRSLRVLENDNLYAIYSPHIKQDIGFLRKWLKTFVISNRAHFEESASEYLQSQGMSLDIWMDAISDGCKGDTLMLYGLSMILDIHTVVHLCNGKIWTTMESPPDDHSDLISKCLIHVAYVGRGLFVELVKREKPLEVIKSKDGLLSYVVGELTVTEQSSFDKILRTGLGTSTTKELLPVDLSVPRNKSTDNKSSENTPIDLTIGLEHKSDNLKQLISSKIVKEPTAIDEQSSVMLNKSTVDQPIPEKSTLSSENKFSYMKILGKKSLKVSLKTLKVTSAMQTVHVTQKLMDNLPTSRYRQNWDIYIPADEGVESDTTLIYWPLSEDSDSDHARLDILTVPPSGATRKMPKFNINWHCLRRRKPRYWFKCKVKDSDSTFSTIRGWNFHHSYVHRKIILKCEICGQKFTSPSAHKSAHVPRTNICTVCNKAFPFKSGLRQHMIVHKKQKRHRCFAGNCNTIYKWASDLNRHVKTHVDRRHQCPDCNYSSREERLFKRHLKKNINVFKYKCMYCTFKTKWPNPFKRHITQCKAKH